MEAVRPDWLQRRNRGVHITIRDVDCAEFDVEAMIATYARWHVTCFSFFTAGYVTTYPTRQALQRVSPWLGDRDLTGEIIAVFHHCGIKAIPMIGTGQLPEAAYLARQPGAGRTFLLVTQLGRSYTMLHYPPPGELIADAVRWVARDDLRLRAEAPPTLQLSLRTCDVGMAVHGVNLTGGERYVREIVPLRDVCVALRESEGPSFVEATEVSSGESLGVCQSVGWAEVTVPVWDAYDVVLFETAEES